MERLLDEIIEDYKIKNENLNIFSTKNKSIIKLENAYDFFLKKSKISDKKLLFMEFIKKIQERIKQKININKKRKFEINSQKRLTFSKKKNFTFILVDIEKKKILIKKNFLNDEYFSFFYLEENNEKNALLKFKNKMNFDFNLHLEDKNFFLLKNFNPHFLRTSKIFFCHISQKKIEEKIKNTFSLKFLEIKNEIIFTNPKFTIISNFITLINFYLQNSKENNFENQIITKRKKSASMPLKIALEEYLEKKDIRQIRREQKFVVQDKILELKIGLDDILKKHNLSF